MQDILTQHITKTLGVCGGMACIAGHRIRVMDIVVWHERVATHPTKSWVCFLAFLWQMSTRR